MVREKRKRVYIERERVRRRMLLSGSGFLIAESPHLELDGAELIALVIYMFELPEGSIHRIRRDNMHPTRGCT